MRRFFSTYPWWNRFIDKVEDHPFEVGISAALVAWGIRALINGLQVVPGSIQELPLWLAVTYCIFAVVGGSAVLFGVFMRNRIFWSYGTDRAGLFISLAAWVSYALGLFLTSITPSSVLVQLALTGLASGCFFRARAIDRREQATLDALRTSSLPPEADHG